MSQCPVCGGDIPAPEGRGRPQKFCSPACLRASTLEIKRLSDQLSKLEEWASHARMWGRGSTVWRPPEVYQAEIDLLRGRLRAVLAANEQDEKGPV